jgi:selenide,water dikinase
MENEVKLTKLAKCAGCGAKVGAGVLGQLLEGFSVHNDPNLLVGFDRSDDASVYKINEELALVQTVDFFPPIADDPYTFGAIAATNALSDVYAMGGEPKLALNIMAVPEICLARPSRKFSGAGTIRSLRPAQSSQAGTASWTKSQSTGWR